MEVYVNKTIGKYKKGKVYDMPDGLANIYLRRKIVSRHVGEQTYQTKVLVAKKPDVAADPEVVEDVNTEESTEVDDLDGLDADELRAIAELRGVKVHHNAGAEKIKEALKSAEKPV